MGYSPWGRKESDTTVATEHHLFDRTVVAVLVAS